MGKLKKPKFGRHVQTYVTKSMGIKINKKWRNAGYISESDYVRDLLRIDIKN